MQPDQELISHLNLEGLALLSVQTMINTIVSGGWPGADSAALDAAIKLGIFYSGWIPKDENPTDKKAPGKYQLHEMATTRLVDAVEKNILESDASLIISHGTPTGRSALTRKLAMRSGRRWMFIDLDTTHAIQAISIVSSWIRLYDIDVLNVTGPSVSKDPDIYHATMNLLVKALCVNLIKENIDRFFADNAPDLRTIKNALNHITAALSFKQKVIIANFKATEIEMLQYALDLYISSHPKMTPADSNDRAGLLKDANHTVIMEKLWENLRETHGLRVVK